MASGYERITMLRHLIFLSLLTIIAFNLEAQEKYVLNVNYSDTLKRELQIDLQTPKINESSIHYFLPSSSSSDYVTSGFENNIFEVQILDTENKPVEFKYHSPNIIKITEAEKLHRIKYKVRTRPKTNRRKTFFKPGGIVIEDEIQLLNFNALVGYLDGHAFYPYEIKLDGFNNKAIQSSLKFEQDSLSDQVSTNAPNYSTLFESPVLFGSTDTTSLSYLGCKFNIAFVSKNKRYSAITMRQWLAPVIKSVGDFLGSFPVSEYQFIIYLDNFKPKNKIEYEQFGGLHHTTSSLYILPSIDSKTKLKELLQRLSMHELLHLLSPLVLYGEDLAPPGIFSSKNSKHLWLYEGVTEYFALLLLNRNQLIKREDFFDEFSKKIFFTEQFPKVSLTDMSENLEDNNYNFQFKNFYNKAALLAFILDIELRDATKGEKGLEDIIKSMAKNMDPQKGFDEDGFFDWFSQTAKIDFSDFFKNYIVNGKSIQYGYHFTKVAYDFYGSVNVPVYEFGGYGLGFNEKDNFYYLKNVQANNPFKFKSNDVILAIDNVEVKRNDYRYIIRKIMYPEKHEKVKIKVKRSDQTLELEATPFKRYKELQYQFVEQKKPANQALINRFQLFKSDY